MSKEHVAFTKVSVRDNVLTQEQQQWAKPIQAKSHQNQHSVGLFALLAVLILLGVFVIGASGRLLVDSLHFLSAEKQLSIAIQKSQLANSKAAISDEGVAVSEFGFSGDTLLSDELAIAMHNLVGTNDPDGLLLLASYQAVVAARQSVAGLNSLAIGIANNAKTTPLIGYEQAIETLRKAQQLRPMQAKAFLMEAEYLWRSGADFKRVSKSFDIALLNSPYDKLVALFGLEFYLAYWLELNIEQRVLVSSYLFEPRRYRISKRDINTIIARSPEKQRACRLLDFNGVRMRTCKGTQ